MQCSIEGCGTGVYCKAMCRKHYGAAYHAANRDRDLERNRRNYAKNREQYLAADRERRVTNGDLVRARDRARYAENPRRARDLDLRRTYGITLDQYEAMLAAQGGGCGICGSQVGAKGKAFAVDHSHETGAVRGILCARCNVGLGMFRDDAAVMTKAIGYLEGQREVHRAA